MVQVCRHGPLVRRPPIGSKPLQGSEIEQLQLVVLGSKRGIRTLQAVRPTGAASCNSHIEANAHCLSTAL